jgi:prophage antirepressor-like protein
MSNLSIFDFNENPVRVINMDGNPWFVASDVCRILEHTNTSVAIGRLDDDEKQQIDPKQYLGSVSNQDVTIISESGLYSLVLTSRKPEAKVFKKWLTSNVLPSIRKTGKYEIIPSQPVNTQLPQKDPMELLTNAITVSNQTPDGYIKRLFDQLIVDRLSLVQNTKQLSGVTEPVAEYTIVKVRAKELGYTLTQIGNGSALGTFVKKKVNSAFQERVGRYDVYHYEINNELDGAIHDFFRNKGVILVSN